MTANTEVSADTAALAELRTLAERHYAILSAGRVLYWDERTHLEDAGVPWRISQRQWLAAEAHNLITGPEMSAAINTRLDEDPSCAEAHAMRRDAERAQSVDLDYVERFTEAKARCRATWHRARLDDNFAAWVPELEHMLAMIREHAERIGYADEPYEAMLALWEPKISVATVEQIFEGLAPIREMAANAPRADESILERTYDPHRKQAFEHDLLTRVGFDFTRGRIDFSARAFCTALGPDDVRLTTRFHGDDRIETIFSSIHEAGHGIYAQSFGRLGVPATLAHAPGLGIDESQSRMYENIVGRSKGFWEHAFHLLTDHFPDAIKAGDLDDFHQAVTAVRPGAIRVGSDELTYNQHIQLRFELERAMVNGDLAPADLPGAWNDRAEQLLGERPASDTVGCLQDVHWSIGQWGYFPTYTLGNVYSSQLVETACEQHPSIADDIEQRGAVSHLTSWMDDNVARHGRAHAGSDLVRNASGSEISVEPLVRYLTSRYA